LLEFFFKKRKTFYIVKERLD